MDKFLLEKICRFTNAEAHHAKYDSFENLTPTSLLGWLAILINAGRAKARGINVEKLWSADPVYGTMFYRAVMSRNQYQSIFRYTYFTIYKLKFGIFINLYNYLDTFGSTIP